MRKNIVVGGIIFLVVGVFLFFYGFHSTFWLTIWDTAETIPVGQYWYCSVPGVESGMMVHIEYATSDEVEFYVFDEYNLGLFTMLVGFRVATDFEEIYYSAGKSESYTFRAPKDDTYYVALVNFGDNDVSVIVKILTERVWIKGILYVLALLLFVPIGLGGIIGGLRAKPKVEQVASKLLDVMKLYERMKISELATRFKTTEADIELALIKLKSRGEPIQFDRETREVIYTPSKEE